MALTLQISDSTQTPYSSGASGLVPLRGTASSYAGSPVGEVAGMAGNLVMDNTTGNLWLCTTEGSSGTAVWERMAAYNPVVIAPTASETLPVGTRVIVMPPALTADITLTTPNAGNEGDELLVFGSDSAYTVEVSTGVTTGSPYIEMPDGSQVYSYVIPASSPGAGIRLDFDGTNYRATTFGTTIVAPAVAANEAVNLGQFPASLSSGGYQKLANGLIIQWGITGTLAATSSNIITLPIAFPNAGLAYIANANDGGDTAIYRCNAAGGTTTSITIVNTYTSSIPGAAYLAIGY